ncbi:cache domain-containing protein [Sediminicoccus sp. KRV36]|uniref:cache domain-containing protein n=1 Tax=Sediminicoccus sp. KRV36 TaxID=3133721 RepID=UPI00200BCA18|nr:cache domain-containing protein [Sediminicoccus rosea]UPY39100.1 GAF domain-containing protein [Sediminicoccus rosea]
MSGAALLSGARRRQAALRIILPLAGVALIIGAVLTIALHSYQANRQGALALSEEMLGSLEARVAQEIGGFFASGERAARYAREVFNAPAVRGGQRETLENFGRAVLDQLSHISLFMAADQAGNYIAVRRVAEGGYSSFVIRNEPGPRSLVLKTYDRQERLIREEPQAEHEFDPRTRPWFRAAISDPDEAWTDLYLFFTDRVMGLTVATAVRRLDEAAPFGVIALDVSLRALSDFLASLQIGRHGQAVIVDAQGRIIAHPQADRAMRTGPEGPIPNRLDEIGDPVLARAFDLIRLQGNVHAAEDVNGARHIIISSRLGAEATSGWRLVITVPEDDFTGFVAVNNRRALVMSLAVVLVALGLALLLVRQGLRADVAARRLLDEKQSIASQSAAFAELAGSAALFDPASDLPPDLTERLASVAQATRACIWRLTPDGRGLTLEDGYDAERGGHTSEAMLLREEMPAFFARLASGEPIIAADAARERSTAELHRIWLNPLGTTALHAIPIRHGARSFGVVWLEDPQETAGDTQGFLEALAKLLAVRMAGGQARLAARAAAVHALEPEPAAASAGFADSALSASLSAEVAADVYPQVAVMVVRFTDPLALAGRRAAALQGALVGRIAHALERAAQEAGIPYLKLLGDEVVAAAGLTPEEAGRPAARRIAAFALAARSCCAALFEEAEAEPGFRIGLDMGVAIGSRVGSGEGFLNLWGDAARLADQMAQSAPLGGIQATEAVYAALAGQYLFRPRGAFHVPLHGPRNCYILAAAL